MSCTHESRRCCWGLKHMSIGLHHLHVCHTGWTTWLPWHLHVSHQAVLPCSWATLLHPVKLCSVSHQFCWMCIWHHLTLIWVGILWSIHLTIVCWMCIGPPPCKHKAHTLCWVHTNHYHHPRTLPTISSTSPLQQGDSPLTWTLDSLSTLSSVSILLPICWASVEPQWKSALHHSTLSCKYQWWSTKLARIHT